MTAMAMGALASELVPIPRAIGTIPKTVAIVVIKIGLRRTGPAASRASFWLSPELRSVLV